MPTILKRSAQKTLRRADEYTYGRLMDAIRRLESGKRADVQRLVGRAGYRLRVGDWRVLFEIDGDDLFISAMVRRREAYRS